VLDSQKLQFLIDEIYSKVIEEVTLANRSSKEELNKVLDKYGLGEKKQSYQYCNVKSSKIILFGRIELKQNIMNAIAKDMGISPDRIDYVSYDDTTNYDISNLEYSNKYSDILAGPVPHKAKNMGNYSSMIEAIESNSEMFPPLIRVMDETGTLRISKSSFKNALLKTQLFKELNSVT
jgi:hypothetical protein